MIAIPRAPEELSVTEWDLYEVRRSYLRRATGGEPASSLGQEDLEFLASEVKQPIDAVLETLAELEASPPQRLGV